ncbi:MAG TPA: hypothetical protein VED47_07205, partial [Burkholderiaceae bacterium]|nr:hypothetical protein [Burkholderiaceae bacterium]
GSIARATLGRSTRAGQSRIGPGRRISVRRRVGRSILAAILPFIVIGSASANVFACKNAKGEELSGGEPPQGCAGEICEIWPNGKKECGSPRKTAEQKQKREDEEKALRDCLKKRHDAFAQAEAFLDRYPKEEVIERERDTAVAGQEQRIGVAKQRLAASKARLARLEKEAEFYGTKHPMPEELQRNADSARELVARQDRDLAGFVEEMQQINDKYDAMVARRRDLLKRGLVTVVCGGEK